VDGLKMRDFGIDLFYDDYFVCLMHSPMLQRLLKYVFVSLILFQSWHGAIAGSVEPAHCEAGMTHDMDSSADMMSAACADCDTVQHTQQCAQACAMVHAVLLSTRYIFGDAQSLHTMFVLLPPAGISHRPLIPPPISFA
jgi:hypothetical protein